MKNEQGFKLIDGVFTPEEVGKVITALIDSKINYHNLEDFSNHIRFNNDLSYSKIRVGELIEAKVNITNLLEVAKAKGVNLVVNSMINISFDE